jgi:hypothetical protein
VFLLYPVHGLRLPTAWKALRFITRCELANYREVEGLEDEARQLACIFATIIIKKNIHGAEEDKGGVSSRLQVQSSKQVSSAEVGLLTTL